jgi:hypothetical protein
MDKLQNFNKRLSVLEFQISTVTEEFNGKWKGIKWNGNILTIDDCRNELTKIVHEKAAKYSDALLKIQQFENFPLATAEDLNIVINNDDDIKNQISILNQEKETLEEESTNAGIRLEQFNTNIFTDNRYKTYQDSTEAAYYETIEEDCIKSITELFEIFDTISPFLQYKNWAMSFTDSIESKIRPHVKERLGFDGTRYMSVATPLLLCYEFYQMCLYANMFLNYVKDQDGKEIINVLKFEKSSNPKLEIFFTDLMKTQYLELFKDINLWRKKNVYEIAGELLFHLQKKLKDEDSADTSGPASSFFHRAYGQISLFSKMDLFSLQSLIFVTRYANISNSTTRKEFVRGLYNIVKVKRDFNYETEIEKKYEIKRFFFLQDKVEISSLDNELNLAKAEKSSKEQLKVKERKKALKKLKLREEKLRLDYEASGDKRSKVVKSVVIPSGSGGGVVNDGMDINLDVSIDTYIKELKAEIDAKEHRQPVVIVKDLTLIGNTTGAPATGTPSNSAPGSVKSMSGMYNNTTSSSAPLVPPPIGSLKSTRAGFLNKLDPLLAQGATGPSKMSAIKQSIEAAKVAKAAKAAADLVAQGSSSQPRKPMGMLAQLQGGQALLKKKGSNVLVKKKPDSDSDSDDDNKPVKPSVMLASLSKVQVQVPAPAPAPIPVSASVQVPDPIPSPVSDPIPVSASVQVPDPIPSPVSDPIPDLVAIQISDPIPVPVSDPIPDPASIQILDPIPDPVVIQIPVPVSDPIPDPASILVPIPVSDPIPDPVVIQIPDPVSIPDPASIQIPDPVAIPEANFNLRQKMLARRSKLARSSDEEDDDDDEEDDSEEEEKKRIKKLKMEIEQKKIEEARIKERKIDEDVKKFQSIHKNSTQTMMQQLASDLNKNPQKSKVPKTPSRPTSISKVPQTTSSPTSISQTPKIPKRPKIE